MNLPETWRLVRLSAICEINPPLFRDERPSLDILVSFIPMAAVDAVEGKITHLETRALREVSKGFTPFREKDVLFAKITPSMENGKAALATGLENGVGFGSTEFHVLRPTEHLLPDYLFYFIRQPWFRERASSAFVGSVGQQRVPQGFLERVLFPLPTLFEQERIVTILRQADELRSLQREGLVGTQQLIRALFVEMFGDPITNPKGWKKLLLDEVIENIDSGWSPTCLDRPAEDHEWGVLKLGAVTSCRYLELENKALPEGLEPNTSIEVKPGDLLLSRKNTHDLVAACAFVFSTRPKLMLPDLIFRLRMKEGCELMPEFLWALLTHPGKRKQVQALATGSAGSMPNIPKSRLLKLRLESPPRELQRDFASRMRAIHKLSEDFVEASNLLENNFSSLQQRAFSGDLTSVWRNSHRRELEAAAHSRDGALGRAAGKGTVLELPPIERAWLSQPDRDWLLNQLSKEQGAVFEAIRKWHGILIAAEELDEFRVQCFSNGSLDNTNAYILRTLDQLAGLGLVVKVSVPNQQAEYVTGYRGFREDELSHIADRQSLAET